MMKKFLPWIIWSLGSFFFFSEYFVRVSTGVLSPLLMSEMNLSALMVGALSAFFYYAYIGMQVPVGVLVDRFGAKRLLVFTTFLFGLACLFFSFMHHIEWGYFYRFLMGFSGAFAFVGTLKLITIYFKPSQFAMLAGITQGMGMLGAVIGEAPMSYAFHHWGWRPSMFWIAFIFFACSALFIFLVKEPVSNKTKVPSTLWQDLKAVSRVKALWLNCLFIGLMYAPTTTFGEQWGSMFMGLDLKTSITDGAFAVGFIFIGMACGCPLVGFLSDHLGRRVSVMRWCSLACLALIILIVYQNRLGLVCSHATMYVLMFAYGIFNSAIVPSYALSSEIVLRKISGMALGITNMASVIVGSIFIPLVGFMVDHVQNGMRHYAQLSVGDFQVAFILLPLCFVVCFILTFFIQETYCRAL